MTGEAWPADSDSTRNFKGGSRRGGESKDVKCRKNTVREENLFPRVVKNRLLKHRLSIDDIKDRC